MSSIVHNHPPAKRESWNSWRGSLSAPVAILAAIALAGSIIGSRSVLTMREQVRKEISELESSRELGLEMIGARHISFRQSLSQGEAYAVRNVSRSESGTSFTLVVPVAGDGSGPMLGSRKATEILVRFESANPTLNPQTLSLDRLATDLAKAAPVSKQR